MSTENEKRQGANSGFTRRELLGFTGGLGATALGSGWLLAMMRAARADYSGSPIPS